MVIEKYNSNFHATYDELTQEVQLAMAALVSERLQEWFAHLDGEPEAAREIARLEGGKNFSAWFATQGRRPHPGSPKFEWPANNEDRLGMQLLLFRSMARGDISAAVLGKMYLPGSGQNVNESSRVFINQYFRPMTKELIRHLRRVGEQQLKAEVPASDRVVSLNHNSEQYAETVDAAEQLETAIQQANDFPDIEEKEQRVAEVSAVRRLLQAARVRIEPVISLLKPLADQVKTKLSDTLIGMAVTKFLMLLGALIGYIWALL
jgi:hypothetical protein